MRFKNKREKMIAIVTGCVLGLVLIYTEVVSPLMASQDSLTKEIRTLEAGRDLDNRILNKAHSQEKAWAALTHGQLPANQSAAESQLLDNLFKWAQASRLTITSQKPERTEKEKDLMRLTYRVAGNGGMEQIAAFLWEIQNAKIPVRISDVTISTRKDGTDDLSINVGISTLFMTADTPRNMSGSNTAAKESL